MKAAWYQRRKTYTPCSVYSPVQTSSKVTIKTLKLVPWFFHFSLSSWISLSGCLRTARNRGKNQSTTQVLMQVIIEAAVHLYGFNKKVPQVIFQDSWIWDCSAFLEWCTSCAKNYATEEIVLFCFVLCDKGTWRVHTEPTGTRSLWKQLIWKKVKVTTTYTTC